MARRKKELTKLEQMLDELIGENPQPEDILGQDGLIKQLMQRLMEQSLAGELSYHLHQPESAVEADRQPCRNSRNGHSKKTVQSEQGRLELDIPCDRNGTFELILVPKHQRRLTGLDELIVSLYGRGLSTRDIQA
jgi:putative transposase